jgi:hypothetical protein
MESDEREGQEAKAASSICTRWEGASNVTAERLRDSQKQDAPIVSSDEGMQMDEKEQPMNAAHPRLERRDPASNVTVERSGQLEKQLSPSVSTEDGRESDESLEQRANPTSSTCRSRDPGANVSVLRLLHS